VLLMSMEPNLVVDIGGFIDTKLEGLRCHTSQLGEQLDDEDVGFVDGMAEFSAAKEPFRYGEAFQTFRFDLPGTRPRRSPGSARPEARVSRTSR
jgi:LmbE family N-acetylglucosaminyl deacetylase